MSIKKSRESKNNPWLTKRSHEKIYYLKQSLLSVLLVLPGLPVSHPGATGIRTKRTLTYKKKQNPPGNSCDCRYSWRSTSVGYKQIGEVFYWLLNVTGKGIKKAHLLISQVSLKYITIADSNVFQSCTQTYLPPLFRAEQELAPSFSASCTMSIQHETKEGLPRRHRARFPSAFLDKQHIKERSKYIQSIFVNRNQVCKYFANWCGKPNYAKIYAIGLS